MMKPLFLQVEVKTERLMQMSIKHHLHHSTSDVIVIISNSFCHQLY